MHCNKLSLTGRERKLSETLRRWRQSMIVERGGNGELAKERGGGEELDLEEGLRREASLVLERGG